MNGRTLKYRPFLASAALIILGSLLLMAPASAQRRTGTVGIGGQIGDPSGVTIKFYNARGVSWDFLAAWDDDDFFFVNGHALYERHLGTTRQAHFFFGPGAFIGFLDRDRKEDDDVVVGVSGTFGINYVVERFEIFGQITPRISVIPDTDGEFGGGVGVRYYF